MPSTAKRQREEEPAAQADDAAPPVTPGHVAARRRRKRLAPVNPRKATLREILDWAAFAAVGAGLVLAVFYLAFA